MRTGWTLAVTLGLLAAAVPSRAQVLRGRVLDAMAADDPVELVLVKLVDADGNQHAASLTDSLGRYELRVPGPGQYHIDGEALGWQPYRSALFEMTGLQGVFQVDLLMVAEPVPIAGLEVNVDRLETLRKQIHLHIGRNPTSLRFPPIGKVQIDDHWQRAHDLVDLVRWEGGAGIQVVDNASGVCFQFRRGCLPMYLNGMRADATSFAHGIPLQMLEVIVVMTPGESMQYPGGGVFLYTTHWIR